MKRWTGGAFFGGTVGAHEAHSNGLGLTETD